MPSVPGLDPDVDLDGDGLERFETDAAGHIERCIDGDLTFIPGRDCHQDDRIADGFSMVFRLVAFLAVFAGLRPGWESRVEGECEHPPDESLWGFD